MDDFEFVFALYSLLLGLAIGWLTPLLAIFVMLDLLSFWSAAWLSRGDIAVSSTALLAVAAFASVYYLAARLVFPSHPEGFANLDVHYFRVRRIILGLLLVLLGAQLAFYASQPDLAANLMRPLAWIMTIVLVALMAAAMWVRDRRWSLAILTVLIARYVVIYLL